MIERFQFALQTPVGFFLVVLVGILLLLLFIYAIFVLRQRRQDAYRHRNSAYFDVAEAAAAAAGYRFVGQHHGHFFGRETHVQDKADHHHLCLIAPPEAVTSVACDRFRRFLHALEGGWPPLLAPYRFCDLNEHVVLVQEGLLYCDGKPLMPLTAYVKDKRFTTVDKEKVLMMVAHAMAQLHEAYMETGEHLYHGFLLPSTIFIDIDAAHRLSHLLIADAGFAFALQPHVMHQRLQELAQGKLPMEKYRREELLALIALLAPEQRDSARLVDVGPAADFFAFGSLAMLLFTGNKNIKWESVPSRWRPFIQRCLNNNPHERPKDFNELGDWVDDPDVALTVHDGDLDFSVAAAPEQRVDIATLAMTIHRDPVEEVLQKRIRRKSGEVVFSLSDCLLAGSAAMKMSRWEIAKTHYEAALGIESDNPEVLLKLAVCVYELGDMKAAEHYLNAAKVRDPSVDKSFRQHIAFRI